MEMLFADDTSHICRSSDIQRLEQDMINIFALYGEDIHPGKTERLALGVSAQHAKSTVDVEWSESVRFLGGHLQGLSNMDADNKARLKRARDLWRKLNRQLGRLHLPERARGMLFVATVVASLLYNLETRWFTTQHKKAFQVFLNNCTFGLMGQRRLTMREEQKTLSDLRKRLGLQTFEYYLTTRRLQFLQRLATLSRSRLERQSLFAWLHEDLSKDHKRKRINNKSTVRGQLSQTLDRLRGYTDYGLTTWRTTGWLEAANDSDVWSKLVHQLQKDMIAQDLSDCWHKRHRLDPPQSTDPQLLTTGV